MDFNKAKQAFEKYIDTYNRQDKQINLKYIHTYKVVELIGELAFRLNLDKEEMELARLIGLLHDIGRFEQIRKYDQIDDVKTNMDHAQESCIYLFDEGHIRDFIDETKYDEIIKKAILNHNKLEIETMDEKSLLFSKMIRDVDKIDIFRSMAINYEMEFKSDDITEKVLKQFSEKKTVDIKLIKNTSDKTIQTLSLIYDINFDESFDILVETDNFDLFLGMIEVEKNSEKLWKKLRELTFDKINKGIGD